jgi:hypothetical protein
MTSKGGKMKITAILLLSLFSFLGRAEDAKVKTTVGDSDRKPVVMGKYIAGGVVGSAVGFGIGHAIQGRYGERGWIFSVTEGVGALLATSSLLSCMGYQSNQCNSSTGSTGLAIFMGFHIWEVVDVWTGATGVEEKESETEAYILPTGNGTQMGFAWRF